ncbi:MAG: hypothetical protein AAFY71_03290 [Bacteroidota bacterium]
MKTILSICFGLLLFGSEIPDQRNFQSTYHEGKVFLNWKAVNSADLQAFYIEKKGDSSWVQIGKMVPKGDPFNAENYMFIDLRGEKGQLYRLRKDYKEVDEASIDSAQAIELHQLNLPPELPMRVDFRMDQLHCFFPFPAAGELKIQVKNQKGEVVLKEKVEMTSGKNIFNWDISSWQAGHYYVETAYPSFKEIIKLVKR